MKDLVIGLSLLGMVSACSPTPQAKDNVRKTIASMLIPLSGMRTTDTRFRVLVHRSADTGKPRIRSWLLEILFGI